MSNKDQGSRIGAAFGPIGKFAYFAVTVDLFIHEPLPVDDVVNFGDELQMKVRTPSAVLGFVAELADVTVLQKHSLICHFTEMAIDKRVLFAVEFDHLDYVSAPTAFERRVSAYVDNRPLGDGKHLRPCVDCQ